MHGDKLKKRTKDIVMNFLIDDYSSWQLMEITNLKRDKSSDRSKNKKHSLRFRRHRSYCVIGV